jgi:DHA2 family multidrug resistance protein-like MFS transporter
LPVVYGLKEIARSGWQFGAVVAVAAGLVFAVVFARRQRRLASPLVDLQLFRNRSFSTALGIMLLGGVVMTGITLVSTLYMQTVAGLSSLQAGLWLVPQYVAMATGSVLAPTLARRIHGPYVMAIGLAIAGSGLVVLTQVDSAGTMWLLVTGLVLASAGIAFPMALVANLVMGSAPPEQAGSAASIVEASGEFGVAVGVATLGTLGAAVYRSRLGATMPAAVPADAAHAAREGIAAALVAAQHLPVQAGADLLHSARAAFTAGLNTVAVVGAATFIALAILAAIVLRGPRQGAQVGMAAHPDELAFDAATARSAEEEAAVS